MKYIIAFFFLIHSFIVLGQETRKFNFGFEDIKSNETLSQGWYKWGRGTYDLSIDSIAFSGKRSAKITSNNSGTSYGSLAYKLPGSYTGKTIKLEGYMKLKNVKDGYAGLLLRIDGNGNTLAFDNMKEQNINGTEEWKKYSITMDFPEEAENILVAGILTGTGEAWFDDFFLTIDGKSVETLKEKEIVISKAQLDNKFDNGSNFKIAKPTSQNILDLELLGRVWGFLKYNHPQIAKGNYNWDYELFRFLPQYIKNENQQERDNLLLNWIKSLGNIEKCESCKTTNKSSLLKPDLKWIDEQNEKLREKLISIYENRSQGEHYYVRLIPNVGNPEFINEKGYSDMPYPDDGFRLLSLYRYWNMIQYFYPNKHLLDKDWNSVLREYIPIFLNTSNELEYELSTLQLIAEIHDTHGKLYGAADKIDQWKGEFYAPVHLRFIEDKLTVVDFYNNELKNEVGLEIGDVISEVNGKTIENIIKDNLKYYPASNMPAKLLDISADILRSNNREIKIRYISNKRKKKSKTLKLYPKDSIELYRWYRKNDERSYKMLDNNIGYITLQTIKKEEVEIIKKEFKDTQGIIIDIRNYPSAFVAFSLGSYFVSTSTPFSKYSNGNVDNPGEFQIVATEKLTNTGDTYKGKLVVIVNEFSLSQAEYTAMALRAGNNTTIIGSTTAGADGNVSSINLPGGLLSRISGIGIYYPDGEETQRIGIVPDIVAKPTIKGIKNKKDELLDRAIEIIEQN